ENNVGVLFQNDNINTLDSDSEFRLVVMAGVAQDEVRKLSERLKFGFCQSIKNGRVLGNNRLWGYDKKDCKLTIVPEQAEAVKQIFELYATGQYGLRSLSQELTRRGYTSLQGNVFNTSTIGHILQNPKYKGWYCGNKTQSLDYRKKKTAFLDESEWVSYPDPNIPAIVSEEVWDKANALFKQRSARSKAYGVGYQSRYPYSGKIICGKHGTSFHRQSFKTREGETEFWKCKMYREHGKAGCDLPTIRTRELDTILAEQFQKLVKHQRQIIRMVLDSVTNTQKKGDHSKEIARLQAQIQQLEDKKEKLLELSMADAITMQEFKKRNSRFKKYYTQSAEQEDLISIGTIGLIKAVDTFRPERKIRLATYASRCVENEVLMYFRSRKKLQGEMSLSDTIDGDDAGSALCLMDVVGSDDTMLSDMADREEQQRIRYLVDTCLTDREAEVIRRRYGLTGDLPQTQRQVAAAFSISRSYVSRIEKRALSKLEAALRDDK
ncbi:MAG: sigma-70 family RNA polymerase sigma factor, partial [Firmicutes bacterium]|nr:sigma-70 family RNA polymerase sigma factor [Bacillota bacterium]